MPRATVVVQIIDDTPEQLTGAELRAILETENLYQVYLTANLHPEQPSDSHNRPHLIIAVLPASREKSKQILAMIRAKEPSTPLLPVVRKEGLTEMLDELSRWNLNFLVAPLQGVEVVSRVQQLLSRNNLSEQTAQAAALARLVGADPVFLALKQMLPLVARYGASVLLTGETGTGKELCARALHYLSARAARAFLPVNCGAIPVELFESELFGHQRGAFTGASATQTGLIEEAEGGTLFLDEIDSLSPAAQVKLLRFIENHTYHSLGSAKERHADVWIVAATNHDLKQKIVDGDFREDLFYRLAVMNLSLPPLRERKADIPLLVNHLWSRYAEQHNGDSRQFSPRAMEALCEYNWPGNIRELENVINTSWC